MLTLLVWSRHTVYMHLIITLYPTNTYNNNSIITQESESSPSLIVPQHNTKLYFSLSQRLPVLCHWDMNSSPGCALLLEGRCGSPRQRWPQIWSFNPYLLVICYLLGVVMATGWLVLSSVESGRPSVSTAGSMSPSFVILFWSVEIDGCNGCAIMWMYLVPACWSHKKGKMCVCFNTLGE